MKCRESNQLFHLSGAQAIEADCEEECAQRDACVAWSGVLKSADTDWCTGCKVPLHWEDEHHGADAHKKALLWDATREASCQSAVLSPFDIRGGRAKEEYDFKGLTQQECQSECIICSTGEDNQCIGIVYSYEEKSCRLCKDDVLWKVRGKYYQNFYKKVALQNIAEPGGKSPKPKAECAAILEPIKKRCIEEGKRGKEAMEQGSNETQGREAQTEGVLQRAQRVKAEMKNATSESNASTTEHEAAEAEHALSSEAMKKLLKQQRNLLKQQRNKAEQLKMNAVKLVCANLEEEIITLRQEESRLHNEFNDLLDQFEKEQTSMAGEVESFTGRLDGFEAELGRITKQEAARKDAAAQGHLRVSQAPLATEVVATKLKKKKEKDGLLNWFGSFLPTSKDGK